MSRRREGDEDGFTLIELVIAMLLLSLIALAVESGLHFGARVWERSERNTRTINTIDMAQTILREILSHTLPRFNGAYVTFTGEPTSLIFDCVPPQAFTGSGTAHVELSIASRYGKDALVLEIKSISRPGVAKKATLVHGERGLRFSYLDASGKAPEWLAYWRDRNRLPDAIRIAADSHSPSSWPTLVVRPLISQAPSCVLDPVSMKCRAI